MASQGISRLFPAGEPERHLTGRRSDMACRNASRSSGYAPGLSPSPLLSHYGPITDEFVEALVHNIMPGLRTYAALVMGPSRRWAARRSVRTSTSGTGPT